MALCQRAGSTNEVEPQAIVCSTRCATALRWDIRELQAIVDGRRSAASMSRLDEVHDVQEDDRCAW